jgi:hypothetical protein
LSSLELDLDLDLDLGLALDPATDSNSIEPEPRFVRETAAARVTATFRTKLFRRRGMPFKTRDASRAAEKAHARKERQTERRAPMRA